MPLRSRGDIVTRLSVPLLAIFVAITVGCSTDATESSPPPTRTSLPTATATSTATPTPFPNRWDCNTIRGTQYRSPSERFWYLVNCLPPTATPGPTANAAVASPARAPTPVPSVPQAPPVPGGVTAIGDSVMLGAESQLRAAIPGLDFHAGVSTQASDGLAILKRLRARSALGSVVIVHLGSNGTFTASQFDEMMASLAGVRLALFVNVRADRSWEGPNNFMLAHKVSQYPNARLADWHAASAGHPEYFWNDGIHLRSAGALAYTALIVAKL